MAAMIFERIAIGGGAILSDPSGPGNAAATLFDLDHWRQRGSVTELSGGRGSVAYIDAGPDQWVLRRFLRGGLPGRLVRETYLFTGEERTRSFRELRLLGELVDRGLPVPGPAAARYLRRGLGYTADLVTRRLPPCETLGARLLAGRMAEGDWRAVGRCLRRFHAAGVRHADLNANNIMLATTAAAGDVWLLDFDRGTIVPPGPWRDDVLARLARSLAKITRGEGAPDAWRQGFGLLRAAHDAAS